MIWVGGEQLLLFSDRAFEVLCFIEVAKDEVLVVFAKFHINNLLGLRDIHPRALKEPELRV